MGGASVTTEANTMMEHALSYADRGFHVFPLCWPDKQGECGCGKGHKGRDIGKAPVPGYSYKDATTDPEMIENWWSWWPWANIGIALRQSGLFVIDVDSQEALEEAKEKGLGRPLLIVRTGGGAHLYYSHATGIYERRTKQGDSRKIDVLSDGYTVVPPSLHCNGRRYVSLWETGIQERGANPPPEWAIKALEQVVRVSAVDVSIPEDVTKRAKRVLQRLSSAWRNRWEEEGVADRSERSMALARAAVESGITNPVDISSLVYTSASHKDKFAARPDGWDDAMRCAQKALDKAAPAKVKRQDTEIPTLITAADLMNQHLPEPRWAVPGILPEGVTLLCGKGKIGKSWLALQLGVATATGGVALGNVQVDQGDALYLALEDNPRRLQSRLIRQMGGSGKVDAQGTVSIKWPEFDPPEYLTLATSWGRFHEGGLEQIEEWLQSHSDTRLIVIDTLEKVRRPRKLHGSIYSEDYEAVAGIKSIADKYQTPVVLIHHVNKSKVEDILDSVSGSTGLTGAADSILILAKARVRADAILFMTGRDIEEKELALSLNKETMTWSISGTGEDARRSTERVEVIKLLAQNEGRYFLPAAIAERLGRTEGSTRKLLRDMANDGDIKWGGRSKGYTSL